MNQHAAFQQRLRDSAPAVFAYVQHLSVKGCVVEFPPLRIAPTAAEHEQYADSGDIFVLVRKRVEIKGLSRDWTSRSDWPFEHFFVDRKHRVESEAGEVALWVYLNKPLTHYAIVKPSTMAAWYPHSTHNSGTGNVEDYICCPLTHVSFHRLARWGDPA
jgi:hypothetical protein